MDDEYLSTRWFMVGAMRGLGVEHVVRHPRPPHPHPTTVRGFVEESGMDESGWILATVRTERGEVTLCLPVVPGMLGVASMLSPGLMLEYEGDESAIVHSDKFVATLAELRRIRDEP